ncbi:TPA: transglutaminase-like cysteine peptidase [Pseudomonas aeruginosa]|nr:transglutaminase-like cysteine peptidase [Pseudomonas aeruginosa]
MSPTPGARRPCPRAYAPWLLSLAATLLLAVGAALAQWDLESILSRAEQRYGELGAAKSRLGDWGRLLEQGGTLDEAAKLRAVNDFFNRSLRFTDDIEIWQQEDYWATPVEALVKGAADCEDYAIAKYVTLRRLGVASDKLRITYVKALRLNQAHMVLTWYASPGADPLVLDDLPGTRLPFDWALYPASTQREAALPILENLALGKDRRFLHRPPVWDLCFLDGQRLAIARANPRLELWNLADDSLRSFELAERGQCLQVFHNATEDSLLVNLQLGYAAQRLFKVPLTPGQPLLLSDCRHLLAQSAQGGFLARQIALEGKDLEDLVLDPAGRIIHRRRLGHYDLFNHHLRIDRGEAFFYLAGNPPEQHQDKGLFRLDPQTFKTREVLRLERHPEHFNNLHGCLLGNRLLLNAKVYNSPHHAYGTQRLTCYDLESRGTLWGATLSAQVSAFAPLPGGQWIALALVDGQVEVRDLASGECRWRYRTADAIPLCLAVSDKLLAIGFSHGGVSLLQVAADGQLIGPPGANPRQ